MPNFNDKLSTFYKKRNEIFKKPLEKIINIMLNNCRYINGESLERHNWGEVPIKLKNIPKNLNSNSFEEDLLNALNLDENEKSIIELLWGDIQLGKRVHACIIMWISVYVLKRPVLYIFRNLSIDQKQLQDDIVGTENYNFNIQYIKTLFEEFNAELQQYFEENNVDYWKDYKIPELKDINSNDTINKLNNKEAINSNDIFCCLMNHSQLAKINSKFSEYIYYNDELVNITLLVDESDLMSPTSSNDKSNSNDLKDSTACEILLAKIYKKVKYVLHITGTAHSLLYNITTRLNDNMDIQIKISKVHKMKRSKDYYGLFNNNIDYNTMLVNPWWDYKNYDIVEDYNINIQKIIHAILYKRPVLYELLQKPLPKYNSLLISEEKIRINQFYLVNRILKDFPQLFIVIYHGNCLRLYLSKEYEKEIKRWSKWDFEKSSSPRLWQSGGIYGSSIDTEKSETLPNNYCYFDINTKILNIKFVYKLLRILFEKCENIKHKTVITITGKYGERGYSFTSDDYDNYSLHLTDQYFVSHASFNCTDISQRLRLQGKYNDADLKNGIMKLTLWTTLELQDIIKNFYVKFIKEIEKSIMQCENWEEIRDLLESIIDNGNFKFGKYMKFIDVSKKRKNIKPFTHFDKKNNGYKLFIIDDMEDDEIEQWCKENKFPPYICINELKEIEQSKFIKKYGRKEARIAHIKIVKEITLENINKLIKEYEIKHNVQIRPITNKWIKEREEQKTDIWNDNIRNDWKKYTNNDFERELFAGLMKHSRQINLSYDKENNLCLTIRYWKSNELTLLPFPSNDFIKKNPYIVLPNNNIKYSILKKQFQKNNHGYSNEEDENFIEDDFELPKTYYWKTPEGWLYLFDKEKPEIYSLDIKSPTNSTHILPSNNKEQSKANDIKLFCETCCKKTNQKNLRVGIKEIYSAYEKWCQKNEKECIKVLKLFKDEFEKNNYSEETSKGVDINNKSGKRGYNLMICV